MIYLVNFTLLTFFYLVLVNLLVFIMSGSSSSVMEKRTIYYCKSKDCLADKRSRLSSLDIHTICELCRGKKCTLLNGCDECSNWSQEDFDKLEARLDLNKKKSKHGAELAPALAGGSGLSEPPSKPSKSSDNDSNANNSAVLAMLKTLGESLERDRQENREKFARFESLLSQEPSKDPPSPSRVPEEVVNVSVVEESAEDSAVIPAEVSQHDVNVPGGADVSLGNRPGRGVSALAQVHLGVAPSWIEGAEPRELFSLLSLCERMELDLKPFANYKEFFGCIEVYFRHFDPSDQQTILDFYLYPDNLVLPLDASRRSPSRSTTTPKSVALGLKSSLRPQRTRSLDPALVKFARGRGLEVSVDLPRSSQVGQGADSSSSERPDTSGDFRRLPVSEDSRQDVAVLSASQKGFKVPGILKLQPARKRALSPSQAPAAKRAEKEWMGVDEVEEIPFVPDPDNLVDPEDVDDVDPSSESTVPQEKFLDRLNDFAAAKWPHF
ncbi:MAG: hypothetical protein AAGM46_27210, partial [Cyanobacteria bacterium J06582_2]